MALELPLSTDGKVIDCDLPIVSHHRREKIAMKQQVAPQLQSAQK
jgi:hypothetical protein